VHVSQAQIRRPGHHEAARTGAGGPEVEAA
jgi:hypothetical protein